MKIISKNFKNESKGSIAMKPTEEEDIWYAYNLIRAGDMIKMKVFRKVTNKVGDYGVKKVKRKTLKLRLKVLKVTFQSDDKGTSLSLKTKNLSENDQVMIGQVQTVDVALLQTFQLYKYEWTKRDFELLDEAENNQKDIDSLVLLYDDGYAGFYFLKKNFTKFYGKLQKNLPKKKSQLMDFYNSRIAKFDQKIWRYIVETFDLDKMKVVVVGGPGFAKTRFFEKIRSISENENDQQIRQIIQRNKDKFVAIPTSTTFKNSINEILKDPKAKKLLLDTKALKEVQKLEEFFQTLENSTNKAVYGKKEILFAQKEGAIKDLMIVDSLLRSTNFHQRKFYSKLVEDLENEGVEVFIFHEDHYSGQKLKEITGIAAILRYQINLDELNDDQESLDEIQENDAEDETTQNKSFEQDDDMDIFGSVNEDDDEN